MRAKRRLLLLVFVMTIVALAGGGVAIVVLYRAAFEQQRVRLTEMAKSQARLLEAVVRFNIKYNSEDLPGGAFAATLGQIGDAHSRLEGFAETGEFTLAKREGEQIVFLLNRRHDEIEEPEPVPFSPELAEPMRRALSEESSGTVIGLDYRGKTVLAAYEPVSVLDLGIVAKIDLAEVRKPFVKAGLLAGGVALVLISFGVVLFFYIGNPIVEQLRKTHDESEEQIADRAAKLAETNKTLRRNEERLRLQSTVLQAINDVFREALTCETEEKLGKTCLAVAERLTGSKFGFLGILNAAGFLDAIAISNPGWDVCEMAVSGARKSIQNMPIRGIDRSTIRDGKSRIVSGDEMATHPDRVGTPEGHPKITAFLGVPLKQDGKTIGMISLGNKEPGYTLADQEAVEHLSVAIVEALQRKRAEVDLRKTREKLVRKTRLAAIGQVSASIAHDLRNPLGSVRNAAYYLKRHVPKDNPKLPEFLDILDKEVEAADRIISGLLALTKSSPVSRQAVDLRELVEDALSRIAGADGVRCRVSTDPDPFRIQADSDQFRQVFVNLGMNAVQAMEGKGELVVEASRSASCDAIIVRDTGQGVLGDVREELFEPLVTTKAKGTGMGLTICRQIVEQHGGTIGLIEDKRPGAAFEISLPRKGPTVTAE